MKNTIWQIRIPRSYLLVCFLLAGCLSLNACSTRLSTTQATPGSTSIAGAITPATSVPSALPGSPALPSSTASPAPATPTPPVNATALPASPTASAAATATANSVTSQSNTPVNTPAGNPPGMAQIDAGKQLFIDNRSNALTLLASFYNAINRKEYVRAYSYWANPGSNTNPPGPYPQFAQGYTDTEAVRLYAGDVTEGVGAGQRYYTVPVYLEATTTGAAMHQFAGCYTLHQAVPALYGAPPFHGIEIMTGKLQDITNANLDLTTFIQQICIQNGSAPGNPPVVFSTPADPNTIDSARYIDDRSTPEDVLRSLFNAVNRKEYVRAYSYWDHEGTSATSQPPAYPQFEQGYANTETVQLTLGQASANPAAGSIYYDVPVVLMARQKDGSTQGFIGCYIIKQPKPQLFSAPPFSPMGIDSAKVQLLPQGTNPTTLLTSICH